MKGRELPRTPVKQVAAGAMTEEVVGEVGAEEDRERAAGRLKKKTAGEEADSADGDDEHKKGGKGECK